MSSLPNAIDHIVAPYLSAKRWLVAYSGGVDSHVLLHVLARYPNHPPIVALHINHQLQPQSNYWAEHCQQQADALKLPSMITTVDINCGPRESLENKARQARYQVFESLAEPDDVLWMGHHQDDQVETLLLRLLRGSGSRGNGAMPASRPLGAATLVRPLLETPRATIEHYATEQQLSWIEDPSNQRPDYDRNFLRLDLLPKLAERWPQYRQTLSRAAALSQESAQLNNELAAMDLQALGVDSLAPSIAIAALTSLSVARQKNLLRYWLQQRGFNLPTARQLQALIDEVINARSDAEPLLRWEGVELRRFKNQLYAMAPLPEVDFSVRYPWQPEQPLTIDGIGTLSATRVHGCGLRSAMLSDNLLQVCFRQGGERFHPVGRDHSQTLKKLLQEAAVESWWRQRLPLIYCGDDLVAVADLWVAAGWAALPDEPGLVIKLQKSQ